MLGCVAACCTRCASAPEPTGAGKFIAQSTHVWHLARWKFVSVHCISRRVISGDDNKMRCMMYAGCMQFAVIAKTRAKCTFSSLYIAFHPSRRRTFSSTSSSFFVATECSSRPTQSVVVLCLAMPLSSRVV